MRDAVLLEKAGWVTAKGSLCSCSWYVRENQEKLAEWGHSKA